MLQTLEGGGAPVGVELEHGEEEGAELVGLLLFPLVLLHQNVSQLPHLQPADVAQLACNYKVVSINFNVFNRVATRFFKFFFQVFQISSRFLKVHIFGSIFSFKLISI